MEDDVVKAAVSELPEMSDEAVAAGRAKLLAAMRPATPVAPLRRRRAWLVATAVVVGVLVLTLVGPALVPDDSPKVGTATAAEALSQAATETGDVVLRPGQFLYVHNSTRVMSSANRDQDDIAWAYIADETYETWVPADQGQTWELRRTSTGAKTWVKGSPADVPKDLPPLMELGDWKARNGEFWGRSEQPSFFHPTPAYLAALPRDPRQLFQKLSAEEHGDQGADLLRVIGLGLDTGLIPAELRKSVYEALAYVPALQIVDDTADLDGRRGTAFGVTQGRDSVQLVIDTRTGAYLGSRELLARDWAGVKAGTVTSSSSLTSRVVGAMGSTS
ncbi:CU044_5270 family protein [Kutzneria buriramensis]|nr:CU044_5270 family protein [Kutzneria buriramensis]